MRPVFALIVVIALAANPVMAQDVTTDKGKLSYAVGWDIGEDIKRRGEFDVETIITAIRDSAAGKDPQVPAEEMVAMLTELQQKVRQEQAEEEGLDRVFVEAGFDWRDAGCSMSLAMNPDKLSPGERCASTSNRNFEGRQGKGGRTHLVSPAMAAAAAIEGHFVDVRGWDFR